MFNRAEILAKLIELRYWREEELGDPTLYREDAQQVRARIQNKLAKETFFNPKFGEINHVSTEIVRGLGDKRETYNLAAGEDYQHAICLSAIMLSIFLKEHPECAATDDTLALVR